jgi:hypothetical protein
LGSRRASRRLSFARPYLLFHLDHGSREIEDEGEGSLVRRSQDAHYLLGARRYLNIGARDDHAALRERLG